MSSRNRTHAAQDESFEQFGTKNDYARMLAAYAFAGELEDEIDTLRADLAKARLIVDALKDPAFVRLNLLSGIIARPDDLCLMSDENGPFALLRSELAEANSRIAQLETACELKDAVIARMEKKSGVSLQSSEDGLWAHFRAGQGYAFSQNLDCLPMAKPFCDEYRAMLQEVVK